MTDDTDDNDDIFDDDDDEDDEDEEGAISTSAWLLVGMTGSQYGVLRAGNGRLAFTTGERRIFDVPLSEVRDVKFPWYYFSGGVQFSVGNERYRLSFVQPNNEAGYPDISKGRRAGKVWKSVLTGRRSSEKP